MWELVYLILEKPMGVKKMVEYINGLTQDQVSVLKGRLEKLAEEGSKDQRLAADLALDQIEKKTYGVCDGCYCQMPVAAFRDNPLAKYCGSCEERGGQPIQQEKPDVAPRRQKLLKMLKS